MTCQTALTFGVHRKLAGIGLTVVLILAGTPSRGSEAAPAGKEPASEPFAVRYAATLVKLAQVTLEEAKQLNAQVPGTVPQAQVTEYEEDVEVAKQLLDAARQGNAGHDFGVYLSLAREASDEAKAEWQNAQQANKLAPGSVSALRVEQLRLRADLAGIAYEEGTSLRNASPEEQDRWKLRMLFQEVQRLHRQVQRFENVEVR